MWRSEGKTFEIIWLFTVKKKERKKEKGKKNLLKKKQKTKQDSLTCRLQLVNWEYLPFLDVQPQQIYLHASPGSV